MILSGRHTVFICPSSLKRYIVRRADYVVGEKKSNRPHKVWRVTYVEVSRHWTRKGAEAAARAGNKREGIAH